MSRYELSVTLLLDESFPENDYDVLRERIAEAFRDACIDFDTKSYRLREQADASPLVRTTAALCSVCHGNGVVKIPGGISTCDHCKGTCYELTPLVRTERAEKPTVNAEYLVQHLRAQIELAKGQNRALVTSCSLTIAEAERIIQAVHASASLVGARAPEDEPYDTFNAKTWMRRALAAEAELASLVGARAPQFDPSNHHNALMCPYCNPPRVERDSTGGPPTPNEEP